MTHPSSPPSAERRTLYAGGPCPTCTGTGELLILRRLRDGKLLFHCRTCGLTFTHEMPGIDPEAGKTLMAVAGDAEGVEAATFAEIRAAGLETHARPAREGGFPSRPGEKPRKDPKPKARIHRDAVEATRESGGEKPKEKPGVGKALVGLGGVFFLIKIALAVIKALGDR